MAGRRAQSEHRERRSTETPLQTKKTIVFPGHMTPGGGVVELGSSLTSEAKAESGKAKKRKRATERRSSLGLERTSLWQWDVAKCNNTRDTKGQKRTERDNFFAPFFSSSSSSNRWGRGSGCNPAGVLGSCVGAFGMRRQQIIV